ncbi:phage baseplate plug family protein [Acidithiobacillus sp.]|uniref:phage baseplate plug family protein n=1 Tax=Acidithiobacillus sp. TaxID=1872118 RepID=UPI003D003311
MTTYIAFAPKSTGIPWTANLTLDGQAYKARAAWNIVGQRWYLSLADASGTVVWYGPIIGSPMDYDILLAPGVFSASTLLYRADTGNFETVP